MAQQVIDGILYSPVNAHAVLRGDLIKFTDQICSWRVEQNPIREGDRAFIVVGIGNTGSGYGFEFGWNEPILRAVGAGVGGLL